MKHKKHVKGKKKVRIVMKEFKKGKLHSGKSGKIVKSRKQAIAISLAEAGLSRKKKSKGNKSERKFAKKLMNK